MLEQKHNEEQEADAFSVSQPIAKPMLPAVFRHPTLKTDCKRKIF
jgi:hypothetical protein